MTEANKALKSMADRVVNGYKAVHRKDFQEAKELLEPLKPLLHQEDKPNVTFLVHLSMAQIGTQSVEDFLATYEELQQCEPKNEEEAKLKKRVDETFEELMKSLAEQAGE
ncbi:MULTISPECIES: hypothetical protein [Alteribacter]|uniref:Uncharacterized protein n=1 Tax=Alteribacter keqinensis TaxID=2483800 RepID=A0A3M7TX16_9BACI|nr:MULTISPECIES: hypothetical protein [Alteribacter]MBM7096248.1 hypothetical protein [Alteribacter salitolerans]RNA70043.1 hypothetical protein EBO34_08970 [Alteribacter keqinensis]